MPFLLVSPTEEDLEGSRRRWGGYLNPSTGHNKLLWTSQGAFVLPLVTYSVAFLTC